MSLWYDVKKKSYAYDAKESWLRSYADKIVSALKTEISGMLAEHFGGTLGLHSADDVNCKNGESVQTALDLEATERTTGDALVSALVAAEEEARIAGNSEIKDLISAEAEARDTALSLKVDKVSGKTLSTNDYSNTDKLKLDGIESGAQVNTVTSVAGKTGAVILEKSDVGLDNIDNTADLDKPVSSATLTALESKANTSDVLTKSNAIAFTPSGSYNPATKKYVDEQIAATVSSGTVDLSAYLAKDNTDEFTPSGDYNPATKKYVDDNSVENLTTANKGITLGYSSTTAYGIAIGAYSESSGYGSAVGRSAAVAGNGGAIGREAKAGNGFAGGYGAKTMNGTSVIDAVQLGKGTNASAKTLQVYDYQLLDANGNIPSDRLANALIVNSSTADSTKQFRITVDDSGTICAVEV